MVDNALTSEQAKQQARNSVMRGAELEVAKLLKENYAVVNAAFADLPAAASVTDAQFMTAARELMYLRRMTLGGKIIELSAIDKLLAEKGAKGILPNGAKTLGEAIPTADQLGVVADQVAEAAGAQVGMVYGATLGNTWSGLWQGGFSGAWDGQARERNVREATARSLSQDIEARLTDLRHSQAGKTIFFLNDSTTRTIADAAAKAVRNPEIATPTPEEILATVRTKPVHEAIRQQAEQSIWQNVYEQTKAGIGQGIEAEKQKIRDGDGSFLGKIKSFIFQLAESLGLASWLAGVMGVKVPSEQEIKSAAQVAADTARDKVHLAAARDARQFSTRLAQEITQSLSANKANYASLPDAALQTIAQQTVQGVAEHHSQLRALYQISPDVLAMSNAAAGDARDAGVTATTIGTAATLAPLAPASNGVSVA